MSKLRFSNGRFQPKGFFDSIKKQWDSMRSLPIIEFKTGVDDYMVVNLELSEQGIEFNIDLSDMFEPRIAFSGGVVKPYVNRNDIFMVPFDPFFTNLDAYLQQVSEEITEGFLLPNGLYFAE